MKLAFIPLAAIVVVLAAGCGGGGSSSGSSSSPSPKDWANNLCSAISTWSDSVKKSGQTLQSGKVTKDNLK